MNQAGKAHLNKPREEVLCRFEATDSASARDVIRRELWRAQFCARLLSVVPRTRYVCVSSTPV